MAAMLPFALSQSGKNPFIGRWDFNIPNGRNGMNGAAWLGINDKNGKLEVWYQPTGGNVYEVKDYKLQGSHLSLPLSPPENGRPGLSWELDATADKLTGTQKRGDKTTQIAGVRAPELNRSMPKAWTNPEPLFNGKDLSGWEPMGNPANSHWVIDNRMLLNKEKGANLKSTRKFQDFKVHFEANLPDDANSGFYLRGRYEVQLEYEPLTQNPPERRIGSIYGRLTPKGNVPRHPGQWDVFDVTLVGRTVTIVHNGVTTIDRQQIEGITGGAIDANEGEPGPFYIQGDHTGGMRLRNITVSVPKQ